MGICHNVLMMLIQGQVRCFWSLQKLTYRKKWAVFGLIGRKNAGTKTVIEFPMLIFFYSH